MNTAYFYLTDEGGRLAHKLAAAHPGDIYNKENFKEEAKCYNGFYLLFRNSFYLCDEHQFSKYTKRFACFSNKNV